MNYHKINLDKYNNHKFIYTSKPNSKKEVGLDGTYILKQDLNYQIEEKIENIEFTFSFQRFDNIQCNKQRIQINKKARYLHIIGFSYWGSTNEFFEIIYQDGSSELIKVPFIDWLLKAANNYETIGWYGTNNTTVKQVLSKGSQINLINFHHSINKINNSKIIKEIILPDNFLIHIFGLTLEE